MNVTLDFLDRFSREHPVEEKVIISPSIPAGRQIGQALAERTGAWLNFRFLSLPVLALETIGAGAPSGRKRLLSEEELLDLIEALLERLAGEGALDYLAGGISARSLAGLVRRSLNDLRLAGIGAEALDPGSFIVGKKGRELALVFGEYEKALEKAGADDLPGLYRSAIAACAETGAGKDGPDRPWHLVLEGRRFARLEREFISAAAGDRLVLVPCDPVRGLEPVREDLRMPFAGPGGKDGKGTGPASDVERLSWLFDPGAAPPPIRDGSLTLFRAAGASIECREILRRLMEEGTPFDQAEVILPPGSTHAVMLHLLARQERLHMTFADGLPLAMTSPGRALFGLLDWIETDFPARKLAGLYETGDLAAMEDEDDDQGAGRTAGRIFLESGIGWGRERYSACLEGLERDYASRLEKAKDPGRGDDDEDPEDLRLMMRRTALLKRSVEKILDLLPAADRDGLVDVGALCLSLERVLMGSGPLRSGEALDEEGREAAVGLLRRMRGGAQAGPRPLAGKEAIKRLRTAAGELKVARSSPRPGHLHVSGLMSGGYSGRPVTFVAGLDEAGFPGRERQDPLLLDEERKALSPYLETSADRLRFSLYNMAGLLSSLRGKVVLSYPDFNVLEERPAAPSSVLLQARRLLTGNPGLDYSGLDAWFSGTPGAGSAYVPGSAGKAIDETDWWLARLGRGLDVSAILNRTFGPLAAGIRALDARRGRTVTGYDGLVTLDPARYDPRKNRTLVFSPTRLEKLASCPYAYFLRYMLGVEPPEEIEFDPAVWLDARNRGTLLHKVFCDFLTGTAAGKERISRSVHRGRIVSLADTVIDDFRKKIPPPSERVFEYERAGIMAALDIFLKVEEDRPAEERPFEFEKNFTVLLGLDDDGGKGDQAFRLGGFIDRIDLIGPDIYRVIDYKTGGYSHYEDFKMFGRGRLLQPALYATAVEMIYAGGADGACPHVASSGYFFPTERGEGREIAIGGFDQAALKGLLKDLLDLIAEGLMLPALDAKCSYCDYAAVCLGALDAIKAKAEAEPDKFQLLKGIRRYE